MELSRPSELAEASCGVIRELKYISSSCHLLLCLLQRKKDQRSARLLEKGTRAVCGIGSPSILVSIGKYIYIYIGSQTWSCWGLHACFPCF